MRLLALVALLAGQALAGPVTDSAGRVVEVPDAVGTVFAAGPPASVLVYALKPDAMTGWPRAPRPEERPHILPSARDLPETGRLTGRGGEANLETVLRIDPDLIVDFGSVRDTYRDLADRTQAQTGIPYLLIDGRFDATPAALRLLGGVLGVPERGEALAADAEATFAAIDAILADVPPAARPRVYLARGPDGLETGTVGSINTEIIERAGGRNVVDPGDGRPGGLVRMSVEQVLALDPEIIVTWDAEFFARVFDDPLWATVTAVRERRVHLSPTAPFGWIDRPPSVNRMMGLRWMARLLWPDRWPGTLRDETRDFHRLWWHVEPSDAELDGLLAWSEGRPPT
jgi:iron complex transport system substrate-binding protein